MNTKMTFKQTFKWWFQLQIVTYFPSVILAAIAIAAGFDPSHVFEKTEYSFVKFIFYIGYTIWIVFAFKMTLESFLKAQTAKASSAPES